MENMNIQGLGNKQLGLYQQITDQKIEDIKTEIIENIQENLGIVFNEHEIQDNEAFLIYCTKSLSSIYTYQKNLFISLKKEYDDIEKEIIKRQKQMIKEIGIKEPSMLIDIVFENMKGLNFILFDTLIRYIKLQQTGKIDQRPKDRKIMAPHILVNLFEKHLGIDIPTAIINNIGPMPS